MFTSLYRNENVKLFHRKVIWIELALLVALVVLIDLVLYGAVSGLLRGGNSTGDEAALPRAMITWPFAANTGGLAVDLASANGIGGVILIVLVGMIAAQEYTWRTFHLSISRGVSRTALILSKFAVVLIPALLIVALPVLVNLGVTALLTLRLEGSLAAVQQVDWSKAVLSTLITAYALLPYAGMAFMLAVLTRSMVAAIGVSLGYSLLVEGLLFQLLTLLGPVGALLRSYVPGGLWNGMMNLVRDQPVPGYLEPGTAALAMAGYILLFVGIAVAVFRKQDLTA